MPQRSMLNKRRADVRQKEGSQLTCKCARQGSHDRHGRGASDGYASRLLAWTRLVKLLD